MVNSSSASQAMTILAANNDLSNAEAGTYADDDSVVSSEVTDDGDGSSSDGSSDNNSGNPEIATLTRAVETVIENANTIEIQQVQQEYKKGILPHSRREWCIVFFAIFLILAVALGTGLGLGFFFMSQSDQGSSNVERGGPTLGDPLSGGDNGGSTNESTTNEDDSGSDNETQTPTYSPSSPPPNNPSDSTLLELEQPLPNDLAGAIAYHVISQEISSIASFDDLAGDNSGGSSDKTMSAPQQARDFLVLRDTLPLALMDEDDEQQQSNGNGGGDDDTLAIPGTVNNAAKTRPYLETTTPAYRVAQRYAAAVVYYATDGTNWETNSLWLKPGVHECDWVGVACEELPIPAVTLEEVLQNPDEIPRHDDGTVDSTTERMIVAIDLGENNMGGYIPQELAALPYLQRLGLWSNVIGGSLPSQLGRLSRLSSLLLDDNVLEGNIPRDIGLMKEMKYLSLGLNKGIVGRIPPELGNLSKLERLNLANMNLRGPIPTAFGQLENLVDLHLENNRLSRGLPEELGNLVNLESLVLSDNAFTGDIPSSWRSLAKLKRLEIQSNKMSFDIDERLCSLRNNAPEGGLLEAFVADCQGDEAKVSCSCCTICLP